MTKLDEIRAKAAAKAEAEKKAAAEKTGTQDTGKTAVPDPLPIAPNDGKAPIDQNKADLTPPIITADANGNTDATRKSAPKKDVILSEDNQTVIGRPAVEADPDFIYSTPLAEQFSLQLTDGTVKAKDGVMKVSASQHAEIQKLINSGRPDIAQNVVLLDPAAAERIALDYMERHKRPAASRGAFDSQTAGFKEIKPNEDPKVENDLNRQAAQAENLRRLGAKEEAVLHADDSELRVPEPALQPPRQ